MDRRIIDVAIIFAVAVFMLAFSWIGFIAADDAAYSDTAKEWLTAAPYLGDTHWALRHPHVLSIAASYGLFGYGEFQLVLPTTIYFFLTLAVVYALLDRFIDRNSALISCLLLTTMPLLIVIASMASADITEAFFIFLSVFLFWCSKRSKAPKLTLFFAGVAAALAWMTRETAAPLLMLYGVLFLTGYRYPRSQYWIIASGFAAMISVELAYMTLMSGDPLYRYKVDMSMHASAIESINKDHGAMSRWGVGEAKSSIPGNIAVNWLVDPFLSILVNQEFALLFWFAIPISAWLCFSPRVDSPRRELARFLSALSLFWFMTISYVMALREMPRYYLVPAIAGIMMIAMGYTTLRENDNASRMTKIFILVGFVSVALLCIYVTNKDFLYAERAAIQLAEENSETVYADPRTTYLANTLLKLKNKPDLISSEAPPTGALFLYSPTNASRGRIGKSNKSVFDSSAFSPKPEWTPVWKTDPGRKISGIVLEFIGLKQFIPANIFAKLDQPNAPLTAYRVVGATTGAK